jgi:hypothetical protein
MWTAHRFERPLARPSFLRSVAANDTLPPPDDEASASKGGLQRMRLRGCVSAGVNVRVRHPRARAVPAALPCRRRLVSRARSVVRSLQAQA